MFSIWVWLHAIHMCRAPCYACNACNRAMHFLLCCAAFCFRLHDSEHQLEGCSRQHAMCMCSRLLRSVVPQVGISQTQIALKLTSWDAVFIVAMTVTSHDAA